MPNHKILHYCRAKMCFKRRKTVLSFYRDPITEVLFVSLRFKNLAEGYIYLLCDMFFRCNKGTTKDYKP